MSLESELSLTTTTQSGQDLYTYKSWRLIEADKGLFVSTAMLQEEATLEKLLAAKREGATVVITNKITAHPEACFVFKGDCLLSGELSVRQYLSMTDSSIISYSTASMGIDESLVLDAAELWLVGESQVSGPATISNSKITGHLFVSDRLSADSVTSCNLTVRTPCRLTDVAVTHLTAASASCGDSDDGEPTVDLRGVRCNTLSVLGPLTARNLAGDSGDLRVEVPQPCARSFLFDVILKGANTLCGSISNQGKIVLNNLQFYGNGLLKGGMESDIPTLYPGGRQEVESCDLAGSRRGGHGFVNTKRLIQTKVNSDA